MQRDTSGHWGMTVKAGKEKKKQITASYLIIMAIISKIFSHGNKIAGRICVDENASVRRFLLFHLILVKILIQRGIKIHRKRVFFFF